jgi:hypothetical protein
VGEDVYRRFEAAFSQEQLLRWFPFCEAKRAQSIVPELRRRGRATGTSTALGRSQIGSSVRVVARARSRCRLCGQSSRDVVPFRRDGAPAGRMVAASNLEV